MPGSSSTNGPRRRVTSTAAVRLDLDDVGAEVGELHRRERPGPHPRQVDHAQPGERGARGVPADRGRARRPVDATRRRRRRSGRRGAVAASTPRMRIGDAGARTRDVRRDHEVAERVAARAAAPTPARRPREWTRHAGTPTACAGRQEVVDGERAARPRRRAPRRRRTARALRRRREDLEVPPVRIAEHLDERPPLAVLRALHEHRAVAAACRCPTGTRRGCRPRPGPGRRTSPSAGTSPSCRPSPRAPTTSMRWPRPSARRACSAPRAAIDRVARGEDLGELAAVADRRHRPVLRVRRDDRQHGALGERDQVAARAPASGPVRPNVEMSTTTSRGSPARRRRARRRSGAVGSVRMTMSRQRRAAGRAARRVSTERVPARKYAAAALRSGVARRPTHGPTAAQRWPPGVRRSRRRRRGRRAAARRRRRRSCGRRHHADAGERARWARGGRWRSRSSTPPCRRPPVRSTN